MQNLRKVQVRNGMQLRGTEELKIDCGKRHFQVFEDSGVRFRQVTKVRELYG